MKLITLILTLSISLMGSLNSKAIAEEIDNYTLSVDDKISISVFNEPELGIENVKISTSGNISMPLIGQVNVMGQSVTEIENTLKTKYLKGYLKKPNVTVTIVEYRPFYINGEIKNPGSYPYRKGLTIQKAVALAGGFTERASKSAISLIGEENKRHVKAVALTDTVKPGDVITISESFF